MRAHDMGRQSRLKMQMYDGWKNRRQSVVGCSSRGCIETEAETETHFGLWTISMSHEPGTGTEKLHLTLTSTSTKDSGLPASARASVLVLGEQLHHASCIPHSHSAYAYITYVFRGALVSGTMSQFCFSFRNPVTANPHTSCSIFSWKSTRRECVIFRYKKK
jgi:hypothetical protein